MTYAPRSTDASPAQVVDPQHDQLAPAEAPPGAAARLRARWTARPAATALKAAVLVGLLAGSAAWSASGTTIEVSVDGDVREVSFHGSTVSDALAEAGLTVGEHDLLAPAASSEVEDGDRVVLRRGRPIDLVVDGEKRRVWVTAESVDEALAQIGLRADGALLSASRSRRIDLDGLTLDVRMPKDITVLVDGKAVERTTTALTVRGALVEAGIKLRPKDKLSHARDVRLTDGLVIRVTRIDGKRVVEDFPIAFGTVRKADASMYRGEERVVQRGRHGVLRRTFTIGLVNGKRVSKLMSREVVVSKPVDKVVHYGTKARPTYGGRSVAGADHLNWKALARCESGGNPRAVSPGGTYRGLYQFHMSTWRGVGGTGDPIDASAAEQTYRAKLLYKRSGRGAWPHCGRYL